GGYIDKLLSWGIQGKIFGIECSKTNYNKLLKRVKNENIEYIEAALGDVVGSATFTEFIGPMKNDGNHRYHQWGNIDGYLVGEIEGEVKVKKYSVPVTTLEEIIENFNLNQIDFLKMDIESGEYCVVDSMTQELANKITQISMETHIPKKNPSLIKKLMDLGYTIEEHKGLEIYAYR